MRLYFDTCSLNRPWDDQSRVEIHLEAESVLYLIAATLPGGSDEMVSSDYLMGEILDTPDAGRRNDVIDLLRYAFLHIPQDSLIDLRAVELGRY